MPLPKTYLMNRYRIDLCQGLALAGPTSTLFIRASAPANWLSGAKAQVIAQPFYGTSEDVP